MDIAIVTKMLDMSPQLWRDWTGSLYPTEALAAYVGFVERRQQGVQCSGHVVAIIDIQSLLEDRLRHHIRHQFPASEGFRSVEERGGRLDIAVPGAPGQVHRQAPGGISMRTQGFLHRSNMMRFFICVDLLFIHVQDLKYVSKLIFDGWRGHMVPPSTEMAPSTG